MQTASTPHHAGGSDTPTPPPDNTGTKSNMIKDTGSGSKLPDPKNIAVPPALKSQTQVPDSEKEGVQVLIPPFLNTGNQVDRLGERVRGQDSAASAVQAAAPGQVSDRTSLRAATAFQSAIDRVNPALVQPMNAKKTLFSPGGFETPSG